MSRHFDQLKRFMEIVRNEGASDLHLSIGRYPSVRLDGRLTSLAGETVIIPEDTFEYMSSLLSEDQKKIFLIDKQIDLAYSLDRDTRFRVNIFMQRGGVGIAMRHIPREIPTLESLNLPLTLKEFALRQQGFFLVVGPVGQGKTTTLASMIQIINTEREEHILTIEDPIEHLHFQDKSIIDQREIGIDARDFASALHAAFRQDVNVIMVGEMRDVDTMSAAVTAAETGHLVFSTLHTNDAVQTINRIVDSFPAGQQNQIRSQISSSLSGIFSQRLVPKIGGGVIPAYELLINNTAISNLIRENRIHEIPSIIQTNRDAGMISMEYCLADLVRSQQITVDTGLAFTQYPDILSRLI
jgi:twitching motility protein PilT